MVALFSVVCRRPLLTSVRSVSKSVTRRGDDARAVAAGDAVVAEVAAAVVAEVVASAVAAARKDGVEAEAKAEPNDTGWLILKFHVLLAGIE